MIRRHHLVEIECVEELTLSALSPSHHRTLLRESRPDPQNHGSNAVSTKVLQHIPRSICRACSLRARQFVTHHVTSPPSFTGLRKAYSITSSAITCPDCK